MLETLHQVYTSVTEWERHFSVITVSLSLPVVIMLYPYLCAKYGWRNVRFRMEFRFREVWMGMRWSTICIGCERQVVFQCAAVPCLVFAVQWHSKCKQQCNRHQLPMPEVYQISKPVVPPCSNN